MDSERSFSCRLLPFLAVLGLVTVATSARAATSTRTSASPMAGNGHNVSFDGRLFIITQGNGWNLMLLRPERVTYDASGFPNVAAGAFTNPILIQPTASTENANAICESHPNGTPFRCTADGNYNAAGTYDCYDVWVFDSDALSGPKEMRRRNLFVMVGSPRTADAYVHSFAWRTGMEAVYGVGDRLRGIEPTVTRDGKLMVWQGAPANDGNIDLLMYAYNATPCAANGWQGPYSLSHMFYDPNVSGRYRLAERQLKAADGSVFNNYDVVHGAYPWLFPDGDALSFTAAVMPCIGSDTPGGCGARRSALSVIGYPTNWYVAHIDGGVNPSTADVVRLFFSSPGADTFAQIPVTRGIDVWPFFGSNTYNYTEIIFDDGLDGNYRGVWLLNESIDKYGNLDRARTPDTSGYGNTGHVVGATFPAANSGPIGKVIELNGTNSYVEVPHASSLSPVNAMSLEVWAKPNSPADCDGNDNRRVLAAKGHGAASAYGVAVRDGQLVSGWVVAGGQRLSLDSVTPMPVGAFTHALMTYEASTGILRMFSNGALVDMAFGTPGATLASNGYPLHIGGVGYERPACPSGDGTFHGAVEEVRLSSTARRPRRVNDAQLISQNIPVEAYVRYPLPVSVTLKNVGVGSWSAGTLHSLGGQMPQDSQVWQAGRVALPSTVAPGAQVTVTTEVSPPTTPGTYAMQFRMVQDGVEWFGDYTKPVLVNVRVRPNDALIVAQSVPTSLVAGQAFTATFDVRNVGTTTWNESALYRLGSQSPQDNGTFGAGRIHVSGNVAPGATARFTLSGTAPSTPGTYAMQWRMVQDAVEWFGDQTPVVQVVVSPGNVCSIGGVNHSSGAVNPANACQVCAPAMSTTAWTSRTEGASCGESLVCSASAACSSGCAIGGSFYANGAVNAANACQLCVPASSTTAWSARPEGTSCGGGLTCSAAATCGSACFMGGVSYTAGSLNPNNACEVCTPSASTTSWSSRSVGASCGAALVCSPVASCESGCAIGGAYYPSGAINPQSPCEACVPSASTSAWTSRAIGESCGAGMVCSVADVCESACFIGGAYVATGAVNPSNVCQVCAPSTSTSAWSGRPSGTSCGGGLVCSTASECAEACYIGGVTYGTGQPSPNNACAACRPALASASWSLEPPGTSCGEAQECSTGGSCERIALASRFVSQSVPLTVDVGQQFIGEITFENLGASTWSRDAGFRIVSSDAKPFDTTAVDVPTPTATGERAAFTFSGQAPSSVGTYEMSWRMEHAGQRFGPSSEPVVIDVLTRANESELVEALVPSSVVAGETFVVEVTFRNSGRGTWQPASHQLMAVSSELQARAVTLPTLVFPGGEATFIFEVTAPARSGPRTFAWQMAQMGTGPFGATAEASLLIVPTQGEPLDVSDAQEAVGNGSVTSSCAATRGDGGELGLAFALLAIGWSRRRRVREVRS